VSSVEEWLEDANMRADGQVSNHTPSCKPDDEVSEDSRCRFSRPTCNARFEAMLDRHG